MTMSPEEREEYLQIYLDETEEELDALIETMLVLEENPNSTAHLNEAFRMVHSMKGAAGMMGFTDVTSVTHLLESRFEKLRSGQLLLDRPTMAVTLRCADYLRECTERLRKDEPFPAPTELLAELNALDQSSPVMEVAANPNQDSPKNETTTESSEVDSAADRANQVPTVADIGSTLYHVTVVFEAGLKLLDMKGQLVVTRVTDIADVVAMQPTIDELAVKTGPVRFELIVASDRGQETIEDAADVHGAMSVTVEETSTRELPPLADNAAEQVAGEESASEEVASDQVAAAGVVSSQPDVPEQPIAVSAEAPSPEAPTPEAPAPASRREPKKKVAETVRVDIDRLDNLLNLAGELVVNKARFAQIAHRMSPAFKRTGDSSSVRSLGESLRSMIVNVKASGDIGGDQRLLGELHKLEDELQGIEEQWEKWDKSRRCFGEINEAIDQLSRVSDSLQRGVLQTRMVPVAPLFNRFKRVVRDLSMEREKKTDLQIRGEKTELDKRMIDELGDPLVHLVRNSIDHGMESPEKRRSAGKPETGTIQLEASHSGNNVFIHIRDDGGGINAAKIRTRAVQRGLLSSAAAADLSDEQVIEFIWHPGFSTAAQVTNISGRGVGMDIVKTRIAELNGTIEVASVLGQGTTFTIRLPLTLAIINSLLFRIRDVIFGVPIDDVREIVSLTSQQIVSVHGKQTFSARGQYLPLVGVDELFEWNGVEYNGDRSTSSGPTNPDGSIVNVVVLQSVGKAVGLKVDELLGGEDIVIKSLSENFVNIRGLSGASIMGDGAVSLLLDVGTVLDMAVSSKTAAGKKNAGSLSTGRQP